MPRSEDVTGPGKLQTFSLQHLFLPKIAFSVFIQNLKQNLLSVLRAVNYSVIICN